MHTDNVTLSMITNKVVEPSPVIRGDIACIQHYLEQQNGSIIGFEFSKEKKRGLERWNNDDPVSEWEVECNNRIYKAQGAGNDFVYKCN